MNQGVINNDLARADVHEPCKFARHVTLLQ